MITCCLCEKTMEPTDECRRLFNMDICPECSEKLGKVAERIIIESNIEKEVNAKCFSVLNN